MIERPKDCDQERGQGRARGEARLRALVDRHHDMLWRTLRHLGVPDGGVDDAVQEVICVLARRLEEVVPGAEAAFLFATATRVASTARRALRRRPTVHGEDLDAFAADTPSADALLDRRRAQRKLQEVLDGLDDDLRLVFVLFEIEERTSLEIASLLGIPQGTVQSRLRRAREKFQAAVKRTARGRTP